MKNIKPIKPKYYELFNKPSIDEAWEDMTDIEGMTPDYWRHINPEDALIDGKAAYEAYRICVPIPDRESVEYWAYSAAEMESCEAAW